MGSEGPIGRNILYCSIIDHHISKKRSYDLATGKDHPQQIMFGSPRAVRSRRRLRSFSRLVLGQMRGEGASEGVHGGRGRGTIRTRCWTNEDVYRIIQSYQRIVRDH